jgi:hypothetical protein
MKAAISTVFFVILGLAVLIVLSAMHDCRDGKESDDDHGIYLVPSATGDGTVIPMSY